MAKQITTYGNKSNQGMHSSVSSKNVSMIKVDKQTVSCTRATKKEVISTRETIKEISKGRVVHKSEFKTTSMTYESEYKSGYRCQVVEKKAQKVSFGGSSTSSKDKKVSHCGSGSKDKKVSHGGSGSSNKVKTKSLK
ncbi:hypothetical protein DITRI_Ditri10aG0179600 [Diplodiscus trichospermus]